MSETSTNHQFHKSQHTENETFAVMEATGITAKRLLTGCHFQSTSMQTYGAFHGGRVRTQHSHTHKLTALNQWESAFFLLVVGLKRTCQKISVLPCTGMATV